MPRRASPTAPTNGPARKSSAGTRRSTEADILVSVGTPAPDLIARLRAGQTVIGMLRPLVQPDLVRQLAGAGVTAISLDGLPRTVSRAQYMDALTSQANVAGYKAVLVAADNFGRFFPMLITAAGTSRPASVLVLGAGVAGLQAMGTARRLGAMVTGYDIRPETRDQIESVGARFLKLESVASAAGEGGYARALTADEQAAQQAELAAQIARFDVVIATAQVPGRRPPLLVTAEAVKGMQAGAVLVDLAASSLGGNIEGSVADQTVMTENGARIIGAGNLPAQMPTAASTAYSHNIVALAGRADPRRRADDRPRRRDPGRRGRHPPGQGDPPGGGRLARTARPRRQSMTTGLMSDIYLFVLAILVGYEVITKVPSTLHTPLMSASNAIHGIVIIGAVITASQARTNAGYVLAFVAAFFAGMNVVGGYGLTDRMLQMFRKRPEPSAHDGTKELS